MVSNKTVGQVICKRPEQLGYVFLFLKQLPTWDLLCRPPNVSRLKLQAAGPLGSTFCFSYPKGLRDSLLLSWLFPKNHMLVLLWFPVVVFAFLSLLLLWVMLYTQSISVPLETGDFVFKMRPVVLGYVAPGVRCQLHHLGGENHFISLTLFICEKGLRPVSQSCWVNDMQNLYVKNTLRTKLSLLS